jgi:hypothetical protein
MISTNDPLWMSLKGGYRVPYDPRSALSRLRTDGSDTTAWQELWNELHHQGDVGEASYLAVVELVSIRGVSVLPSNQLFGLASTIEVERHRRSNPPVPDWLVQDYREAWSALREFALQSLRAGDDPATLHLALAVVALSRGLLPLGTVIWHHDASTLREYLDEHLKWAELYTRRPG